MIFNGNLEPTRKSVLWVGVLGDLCMLDGGIDQLGWHSHLLAGTSPGKIPTWHILDDDHPDLHCGREMRNSWGRYWVIKRCGNEISSERVLRALAKTHQYFNARCTFLSRVCNKISFSNCDDQKIRKKIMVLWMQERFNPSYLRKIISTVNKYDGEYELFRSLAKEHSLNLKKVRYLN